MPRWVVSVGGYVPIAGERCDHVRGVRVSFVRLRLAGSQRESNEPVQLRMFDDLASTAAQVGKSFGGQTRQHLVDDRRPTDDGG